MHALSSPTPYKPRFFSSTEQSGPGDGSYKDAILTPTPPTVTPSASAVPQSKLPVDQHRESILRKLETDRVVIINGETGCG